VSASSVNKEQLAIVANAVAEKQRQLETKFSKDYSSMSWLELCEATAPATAEWSCFSQCDMLSAD
jgi:hypothetical protein